MPGLLTDRSDSKTYPRPVVAKEATETPHEPVVCALIEFHETDGLKVLESIGLDELAGDTEELCFSSIINAFQEHTEDWTLFSLGLFYGVSAFAKRSSATASRGMEMRAMVALMRCPLLAAAMVPTLRQAVHDSWDISVSTLLQDIQGSMPSRVNYRELDHLDNIPIFNAEAWKTIIGGAVNRGKVLIEVPKGGRPSEYSALLLGLFRHLDTPVLYHQVMIQAEKLLEADCFIAFTGDSRLISLPGICDVSITRDGIVRPHTALGEVLLHGPIYSFRPTSALEFDCIIQSLVDDIFSFAKANDGMLIRRRDIPSEMSPEFLQKLCELYGYDIRLRSNFCPCC